MSSFAASPDSVASDDIPQTPGAVHDDGALLTDIVNLSVEDESSVEVQANACGAYSMDFNKAKGRKSFTPRVGCYSPPFVRESAQTRDDHPFNSPPKGSASGHRTPTAPKRKAMNGPWRASASSSGSEPTSPSPSSGNESFYVQEHVSETAGSKLSACTIKPEDSQAIYPPSCCVFVANLLQSEIDEALEVAVTQIFREYGPVFVKIRRDHNHMPFAFCQYTEAKHAERAIKEGRGRLIKGRPCRCEKAKAHRLFFVERKYGSVVTPEEVEDLLQAFGKIEFCRPASHVERSALNLNDGVIVQFVMYDEGQAAHSAFRNHDLYKVQAIAGMASSPRRGSVLRTSPSSSENRAYLERYEVDRRSIFVGNLPLTTSEPQLLHLFEHYGEIDRILLRESVSKFEPFDKFAFAFIEFRVPTSVSKAITAKNGINFGGKTLRVSQKDSDGAKSRSVRATSSSTSTATSSYQSPVARQMGQQPVSPPMTQMSPPGYGSPYPYSFSPFYSGYSNPSYYFDSQGQYIAVPYSPYSPYSYYAGSPAYTTGVSTSGATGSPTSQQQSYYPYYPYQVPQYYSAPASNAQQQQSQPQSQPESQQPTSLTTSYYGPSYSPSTAGSTVAEDRAATPTPTGHYPVVSSSMESQ